MQPQGAACNLSFSYETGIFYQGLYYTALTPDFKTTVTKRGFPPRMPAEKRPDPAGDLESVLRKGALGEKTSPDPGRGR